MITQCQRCEGQASSYHLDHDQWVCGVCYARPEGRIDTRIFHSWEDGSGRIGLGHMEDIKRRVWHPETGEVTRDYGKRYFV